MKPQTTNLPIKGRAKKFYISNGYTCEKRSFNTRKEAFEVIFRPLDNPELKPYKCNRCGQWHLTHKRTRNLWKVKISTRILKPNQIWNWTLLHKKTVQTLSVKTNLVSWLQVG